MDEAWIQYYPPDSKRSLAEWTAAGESRPKRTKSQTSAGKFMASVFWDAHGILFIDYFEKGKTIITEYYMTLLDQLNGKK
ncbi:mariner transposase [Trichonephila clavipes]|nr:mariner transposase [Trichonephila clavipes]